MKTRLRLTLKCKESVATKLTEVLSPDNRSIPSDQMFAMRRAGDKVSFEIESQRLVSTFTSLDSVLSDIALFQEVWLLSRRTGGRDRKEK